MISIAKIVAAVRASRSEFANVFLQAQVGLPVEQRLAFDAVARTADDREAFRQALLHAQTQRFVGDLVGALVAENLEDGTLTQELVANGEAGDAALHALADVARGFDQPHVMYRGFASGMQWTAKILIDDQPAGTGVLIGPFHLLTAWHVVRPLFNRYGNEWVEVAGARDRLKVEFDDVLAALRQGRALKRLERRTVKPGAAWVVKFSHCHDEELDQRLPGDLALLDGFWDYCVIHLDEPIGQERRWAQLDARAVVPRIGEPVIIFQHPGGQPLRVDKASIQTVNGLAGRVKLLRFFHDVNAIEGSSGGPCFDKSFQLFGLHQGAWKAGSAVNRGIPIARILEHCGPLLAPDPSELRIWRLEQMQRYAPVIGCDEFQTLLWKTAVAGRTRLLVITGQKGWGKTFRTQILDALLAQGGHLKVWLNAASIAKLDAAALAVKMCTAAGAPAPEIPPLSQENATPSVWLKDIVVPIVIRALDEVRAGRLVWLLLTDLNQSEIEGPQASEFLHLLYDQVRTCDWLRVVLDGMRGDLPASLDEHRANHVVARLTREQIETCLARAFAELGLDQVGELALRASARRLTQFYEDALNRGDERMLVGLAAQTRGEIQSYLEAADD